ncbi:MAG TPA: hypothetical protein VLT33_34700 [Labilithrix sp.]|nr:hypothetical protein [Labilithrix sp.]
MRTQLSADGGALTLIVGGEARPLPDGALAAVMRRFGKPLEMDAPPAEETLDLGDGHALSRFRFLRRYDVIARDYLVYVAPGAEPSCEMATAVTAALEHLARRLASLESP